MFGIGSAEWCEACESWAFERRDDVQELVGQLSNGLISSVEFSHKILALKAEE